MIPIESLAMFPLFNERNRQGNFVMVENDSLTKLSTVLYLFIFFFTKVLANFLKILFP